MTFSLWGSLRSIAAFGCLLSFVSLLLLLLVSSPALYCLKLSSNDYLGVFNQWIVNGDPADASAWLLECTGPGCGPSSIMSALAWTRAWHIIAAVLCLFAAVAVMLYFHPDPTNPRDKVNVTAIAFVAWAFFAVILCFSSIFRVKSALEDQDSDSQVEFGIGGLAFEIAAMLFISAAAVPVVFMPMLNWKQAAPSPPPPAPAEEKKEEGGGGGGGG